MKTIKIAITSLLCLLVSATFAQRKQDSTGADNPEKVKAKAANNAVMIEKETAFGYHHNNYKQHAKAKKARKWFRVRGHVNKSANVTNYKMPFSEAKKVEKTTVKQSSSPKHSRNYKRPYSTN